MSASLEDIRFLMTSIFPEGKSNVTCHPHPPCVCCHAQPAIPLHICRIACGGLLAPAAAAVIIRPPCGNAIAGCNSTRFVTGATNHARTNIPATNGGITKPAGAYTPGTASAASKSRGGRTVQRRPLANDVQATQARWLTRCRTRKSRRLWATSATS